MKIDHLQINKHEKLALLTIRLQCFDKKDNGKVEKALNQMKAQRKYTKKMSKHYLKQFGELKKEVNYESPESLDDSLSM